MASHAFPLNIKQIKGFAWALLIRSGREKQFKERGPTEKWWRDFKKRHPELSLRTPDSLDRGRSRMTNENVVKSHFNTLKKTLQENGLPDNAEKIFNLDESGINMELRQRKVIVKKGSKNVHSLSKGSRDYITVNCCVSAAGYVLPPMIIYEKSFPSAPYKAWGPLNALYAKSLNGYKDEELFFSWFKFFVAQTQHLGKGMLIIDGHGSHISLNVIDTARENNIILYCLPPHTTHILQPLDVSVYKPLKNHFSSITNFIILASVTLNEKVLLNKKNIHVVFREAFDKTMIITTIKSGFRVCGISPFNLPIIKDRLMPSDGSENEDKNKERENENENEKRNEEIDFNAENTDAQNNSNNAGPSLLIQSPLEHPLVKTGMIAHDLADIFLAPANTNVTQKTSKHQEQS